MKIQNIGREGRIFFFFLTFSFFPFSVFGGGSLAVPIYTLQSLLLRRPNCAI